MEPCCIVLRDSHRKILTRVTVVPSAYDFCADFSYISRTLVNIIILFTHFQIEEAMNEKLW